MDCTIKINCDNAAFENDSQGELGRMLQRLGNRLVNSASKYDSLKLFDENSNAVGTFEITE